MLSKAELIEIGRHYFDKKEVSKMYATPDGNFFFENSKTYADSHAKSRKEADFIVIEITQEDLIEKKPIGKTPKVSSNSVGNSELDELRKVAKGLKIKGYILMKVETLKKKIEEANGTS